MKPFSKSQYTRGMQCVKSLWLYRHKKELQDPVDPYQQAIFDQGTQVGVLAQQWIPGGVLIDAPHTDPERALAQTKEAIDAGARVLYEAAFLHEDVLVRVDILARNPEGGWDLFEVKSTTEVEQEHLFDVAIQRYVLEGAGIKLGVAHLVHLNPDYVRRGALDLQHLFKAVDVNAETDQQLRYVPRNLDMLKRMTAGAEAPVVGIGAHCTKPHACSFKSTCWAHVPKYSVFNLANARMEKKLDLWKEGHKTIAEIPAWSGKEKDKLYKLTVYQEVQRLVAQTQQPYVKAEGIRDLLGTLAYPQTFLDFEAINPAIPPYDGLQPYQPLPFQASVRVRTARGAPAAHFEFLADGTKDPRPEIVDFLLRHLGDLGPIVAYNKSYEGGILKALAVEQGTDHNRQGASFVGFEARLWDLADIFRKAFYAHPDMRGSWSIKKVLPALVPEMTYTGMTIADGTAAMRAYQRLMDPTTPAEERAQIMADLRAYCGQDTEAMVRLLDAVEEKVSGVAR